ncbi:MAG TPA: hypothetical protein VN922_24445, partial [Bacteroidia bacterium]|nr:hypothetical protein [Bacteroidia bacterium]
YFLYQERSPIFSSGMPFQVFGPSREEGCVLLLSSFMILAKFNPHLILGFEEDIDLIKFRRG